MKVIRYFSHFLFALGAALLIVFLKSDVSVALQKKYLLILIAVFLIGYIGVFIQWVALLKDNQIYRGGADGVPEFLTKTLFGEYPYLFTFGKSNSNNDPLKLNLRNYKQDDVQNKKLDQIILLHLDKNVLLLLLVLACYLPNLIFDDSPSFKLISFIYKYNFSYGLYIIFLLIMWLSIIMLIALRLLISCKNKI